VWEFEHLGIKAFHFMQKKSFSLQVVKVLICGINISFYQTFNLFNKRQKL
jgi:hypothetical protein